MRPVALLVAFVSAFCLVTAQEKGAGSYDDYEYDSDYYSDEEKPKTTCVNFGNKCLSPGQAAKLLKKQEQVNQDTVAALEKSSEATDFLESKVGSLKRMLVQERASSSMPPCDETYEQFFPRYCGLAKKCNALGPKECQCLLCVASPDFTDGALTSFVPPPLMGTFWSKLSSGCSREVQKQCLTAVPTFDDMLKGTSRKSEVTPVDGIIALAETKISVEQWTFFLNRFSKHASESKTLGDLVKTLGRAAWGDVTKDFSAVEEFEKRVERSELKIMRQIYFDAIEQETYKLRHDDSYDIARVLFAGLKNGFQQMHGAKIEDAKAQRDQLCPQHVDGGECAADVGVPFFDRAGRTRNTGIFNFLAQCDQGAHEPKKCSTICEATCAAAFDEGWPRCDASAFRRVQKKKNGKIKTVSDKQAKNNQDWYCRKQCRLSCLPKSISGQRSADFLRVGSIPASLKDRKATCIYEAVTGTSGRQIKLKAPLTAGCFPGLGTATSGGASTRYYWNTLTKLGNQGRQLYFGKRGRQKMKLKSQHWNHYLMTKNDVGMLLVAPGKSALLRPFTLSDALSPSLLKRKLTSDDRVPPSGQTRKTERKWRKVRNSKNKPALRLLRKLAADTDKTYERMLAARGINVRDRKDRGRRRLSQMNNSGSLS